MSHSPFSPRAWGLSIRVGLWLALGLLWAQAAQAQAIEAMLVQPATTAWEPVGAATLADWTGVAAGRQGARWTLPDTAAFQYPAGPKGWYTQGFRAEHDGTRDYRNFYGLQAEVRVPKGRTLTLRLTLCTPATGQRNNYLPEVHATIVVAGGSGAWQRVVVPWGLLDVPSQQVATLRFIQRLYLTGTFADGGGGPIGLRQVRLTRGQPVAVQAAVRGAAVQPGQAARYPVTLTNCSDVPQHVALRFAREGFEVMTATVAPAQVQLAPGASATCVVTVAVPAAGVPPGGHERQRLRAVANGGVTLPEVTFTTARDVPRPAILHTAARWDEVRAKVKNTPGRRPSRPATCSWPTPGRYPRPPGRLLTTRPPKSTPTSFPSRISFNTYRPAPTPGN